jgi:hypothetical protein
LNFHPVVFSTNALPKPNRSSFSTASDWSPMLPGCELKRQHDTPLPAK